MKFDVYIIITKKINRYVTYVGYAKEIEKRILLHNSSKGAPFELLCNKIRFSISLA